jgi:hypothetical protein
LRGRARHGLDRLRMLGLANGLTFNTIGGLLRGFAAETPL